MYTCNEHGEYVYCVQYDVINGYQEVPTTTCKRGSAGRFQKQKKESARARARGSDYTVSIVPTTSL